MKGLFRGLFLAVVLLATAALLGACGDASEGKESHAASTAPDAPAGMSGDAGKQAAPAPAPTYKAGDTLVVSIGTGAISGVYYPTGDAIANMINRQRDRYNIRATVESTGGSVFNINAVLAGDLQFGVVQSDRQFQAVKGLAEWADKGPQTRLRAVFSVHPESVTLVAGADTGILDIRDLKGRKVNIGNPGSGQHQNSLDALDAAGLSQDDIQATEYKALEAVKLLQNGTIDAFFYTVGHPSPAIKEVTEGPRKVRIVPIIGVDSLFMFHPYYVPSIIDMSFYPDAVDANRNVQSFGVKATLITSVDVPEEVVYDVTREVFENLDAFRKLHPAFAGLTRTNMLQGLSAPIHPGAMRYYRETGLR